MTSRISPRALALSLACGALSCGASTTWHTAEDFGIRFVQPDSFLIGRFQPLAVSPQAAGLGLKPGLANAVVLVRPEDLGEHSVGAIPVGEIPVIWLDRTLSWNPVAWEQVADTSYAVGERTVYEFPGYPSMYGDASFFYVVSLDPGEWIEIAGHRTAMASGGGVETHFDRVIEELVTTVERVER